MNRFFLAVAMLFGALAFGSTAHATVDAVYPPPDVVATVSTERPEPGGTFDVTVEGCREDDRVDFEFDEQTGSAWCVVGEGSTGEATQTFTAPEEGGVYYGTATLADIGAVIATFRVEVPTATGAGLVVDSQLVGELDGGLNWLFLLLIAIATIMAAAIVRHRLLTQ